jgi:Ni,Fe-hydrogenase III small subunit/formate hydrogenlyase subunit 6/NADH:ubiquinone oxidoreductase subunit I
MLNLLKTRLKQGYRTLPFPDRPPILPDRFRGRPVLDPACAAAAAEDWFEHCPTRALSRHAGKVQLDLGRCLFCGECEHAGPPGAVRFTSDWRLASTSRDGLGLTADEQPKVEALNHRIRKLYGRSLRLRQVSAGGCNACEADVNVLTTIVFDLGRFGIQFVASPRHADGLLITGPVTRHMELALRKTYNAVPPPRVVIAVGACAISGGPYVDHPETRNGALGTVPVDLLIPGCPPHPITILDGLLRWLGRIS